MNLLTDRDYELIEKAQKAIRSNYDAVDFNHTVGAAIRCKNGKIYVGVNVYSLHGACAEQVAIGTAITQGEREFDTIVAVGGIVDRRQRGRWKFRQVIWRNENVSAH